MAQGISVFTSAGNYGQAFLEQAFAPQQATLADGTAAPAEVWDNGTPYERITVPANASTHIDLQWTAPFQGEDGAGAPDALTLEVFDSDGNMLGKGQVQRADGVPTTVSRPMALWHWPSPDNSRRSPWPRATRSRSIPLPSMTAGAPPRSRARPRPHRGWQEWSFRL